MNRKRLLGNLVTIFIIFIICIVLILIAFLINNNSNSTEKQQCPKYNLTPELMGNFECYNISNGIVTYYELIKINNNWYLKKK